MQNVYDNPSEVEKSVKAALGVPNFLMMENAATALEEVVREHCADGLKTVLIICGGGNNGADGLALARRISDLPFVKVMQIEEPKTEECKIQEQMFKAIKKNDFLSDFFNKLSTFKESDFFTEFSTPELFPPYGIIVDCIYGTGFHGTLLPNVASIIEEVNKSPAFKIACDVPSGIDSCGRVLTTGSNGEPLAFQADVTVTMGVQKMCLYSDAAVDFTGTVKVFNLGVPRSIFEAKAGCTPKAQLLELSDAKLPQRKKRSAHKGSFGHTAVVVGTKPGAAILAGTAALRFGSGLVTLQKSSAAKNLHEFMMNPELMEDSAFPERTTAVLLGSGLGRSAPQVVTQTLNFVQKMKNSALVLDADAFYYDETLDFIKKTGQSSDVRVILTPHPKELYELLKKADNCDITKGVSFEEFLQRRYEFASYFALWFPNCVLVSKSAVTYIFCGKEAFIYDGGSVALAKAGSGDVLAGMCAALLAQGYSALEAAKTAVISHGNVSHNFKNNFECSPLLLIDRLT